MVRTAAHGESAAMTTIETSPPRRRAPDPMRILFTTTRTAGHILPLVPLARACRRAGHEVLFAAAPPAATHLGRVGMPFRAIASAPEEQRDAAWQLAREMSPETVAAFVMREVFARIDSGASLDDLTALIATWEPDVVVHEACEYAGAIAAERLGVPTHRGGILLSTANEDMCLELAAPAVDELRERAGLAPDPLAWRARNSPLITRAPAGIQDPDRPASGAIARFRGVPVATAAFSDDWGDPRRPLVYVTYGSVASEMPFFDELCRATVEALADLPVRVLMTVGDGGDPAVLGALPPSIRVEHWVPQAAVMPRAAAMVGHGGSGTTLAALEAGVPQVILPMFADQEDNAQLVDRAGAGIALAGGPSAVAGLRDAVCSLIDDRATRERALEIALEIAAMAPIDDAVAQLERAASRRLRAA